MKRIETATQRKRRLEKKKQKRQMKLANESEKEKLARLKLYKEQRNKETIQQRKDRLERDRLRHSQTRIEETRKQRKQRLERDRLRHSQTRVEETHEQQKQRLERDRLHRSRTRVEKTHEQHQNRSANTRRKKIQKTLESEAIFQMDADYNLEDYNQNLETSLRKDKLNLKQYYNKNIYRIPTQSDVPGSINIENVNESLPTVNNIFEQIVSNPNLFSLPPGWCRIVSENHKNVMFCKVVSREDDTKPYFERTVTIDDQNMVSCTYFNFTVKPSGFFLNSGTTTNVGKLQNIVNRMAMNMCEGVHIPIEHQKFKPKSAITDINGKFRHSACLLINTNNNITQCKYCRTILNTVHRNKLR